METWPPAGEKTTSIIPASAWRGSSDSKLNRAAWWRRLADFMGQLQLSVLARGTISKPSVRGADRVPGWQRPAGEGWLALTTHRPVCFVTQRVLSGLLLLFQLG